MKVWLSRRTLSFTLPRPWANGWPGPADNEALFRGWKAVEHPRRGGGGGRERETKPTKVDEFGVCVKRQKRYKKNTTYTQQHSTPTVNKYGLEKPQGTEQRGLLNEQPSASLNPTTNTPGTPTTLTARTSTPLPCQPPSPSLQKACTSRLAIPVLSLTVHRLISPCHAFSRSRIPRAVPHRRRPRTPARPRGQRQHRERRRRSRPPPPPALP